ncbi:hypothetical protein DFP83_1076 [Idiomarina fontislapidosi]|uniref:Uncharacterized protein n=1 Tax=Idiomarina fontislapidosi TaxID=263723 RepID=A0A432XWX8_9GAMM|nr:hypothetical protein [Idiomarina fontislapidosi]PYE31998.1 hypothetical protein DFP83_1076 [Idiomarina fontislapidosi]RUO53207.1 hypothetical protein CWE25_08235 [Idiomarina fontislapidosi]
MKLSNLQSRVLAEMGIPCWTLKSQQAKPSSTEHAHWYRVGSLFLTSSEPLPVQLPRWLQDLVILFDTRPTAIKPPDVAEIVISVDDVNPKITHPETKKALWRTIQQCQK